MMVTLRDRWPQSLFAVLLAVTVVTHFWLPRTFPYQDYYDWLLQSRITWGLLSEEPGVADHYRLQVEPVPAPNVLVTAVMALLQTVFPMDVAGRVFLSLYAVCFALAYYFCVREVAGDSPLRFFGLMFAFHFFFFMGFLSYMVGLALWIAYWPALIRMESLDRKHGVQWVVMSLVLYVTHAFVMGLFYLSAAAWCVVHRRQLSALQRVGAAACLLPGLVVLFVYGAGAPSGGGPLLALYHSFPQMVLSLKSSLTFFPRFVLTDAPFPLTAVNLGLLILLAVFLWTQRRRFARQPFVLGLVLVCVVLVLFSPVFRIGEFYPVSSRFVPAILMTVPLTIRYPVRDKKHDGMALVVITLVIVLRVWVVGEVDRDKTAVVDTVRPHYVAGRTLMVGRQGTDEFDKSWANGFSGCIQPYLRMHYHTIGEEWREAVPIHPVGLIAYTPSSVVPRAVRLEQQLDRFESSDDFFSRPADTAHRIGETFERVAVIGTPRFRSRAASWLDPSYRVVAEAARVTVFAKRHAGTGEASGTRP